MWYYWYNLKFAFFSDYIIICQVRKGTKDSDNSKICSYNFKIQGTTRDEGKEVKVYLTQLLLCYEPESMGKKNPSKMLDF